MTTQTESDDPTDHDAPIAIDDAGEVTLPVVEVLTGRAFLTGKTGAGKSNSASVVAEELLERGLPLLIVDTDGEYWGLKEDHEILHVGADDECDLQVGSEHASKLAELALEESVPIILDVSGYLEADEADAVVRETARELFQREKKLKRPFLMLVEEIHEYIPQQGGLDDVGEMLIRVAKRGRKRGLGILGLSQRPADVKKDFITQCDWLLWHRLTWKNDTQVVGRVVGSEYADTVQDLDDGEAFLQADFLEADIQRVQVRRKQTFDAGATPDLDGFDRPELKSVSEDLVDDLEAISDREQQRQDRIAQLEAENEDLRETIADLQDELEQARDMTDMAEQFSSALMSAAGSDEDGGEALQQKIDEIREEKNARITELEQENESLRDELRDLRAEKAELSERVEDLEEYEQAVENMDELREAVVRMNDALGIESGEADEKLRAKVQSLQDDLADARAENDRLRDELASAETAVTVPTDYEAFVQDEAVEEAIEAAKESSNASQRYVKGVVAAIVQEGGPVDYETIANYLGVGSTGNISKAASSLVGHGVLEKVEESPAVVDFDMESIADIKEQNRRREQAENLMEDL